MSAEARKGVHKRMRDDATLAGLLSKIGNMPAIAQGWPFDILAGPDAAYFPRITWFVPTAGQLGAPKDKELIVQIDEWVWHEGATGGFAVLEAVDARVVALFDNAQWFESGRRLHSTISGERDFPRGEENMPLRRMRTITVQAS